MWLDSSYLKLKNHLKISRKKEILELCVQGWLLDVDDFKYDFMPCHFVYFVWWARKIDFGFVQISKPTLSVVLVLGGGALVGIEAP